MRILVKLPSRGRPLAMFKALGKAINLANDNSKITYLVTLDSNDPETNNETIDRTFNKLDIDLIVDRGVSTGKIHACNRGVDLVKDWDIILLLSDDMICQQQGWDDILRQEMAQHFPDLNGVLFHNDGFCEKKLNTLCILGRKYYDSFGYIYNPEYVSLWCDNEFMEVADQLKSQKYFSQVLFKHEHPANTGIASTVDELYSRNDKFYLQDKGVFNRRKALNFDL